MSGKEFLGVLMLDVAGLELTAQDREVLQHPQVGGVILGLHGRNFASIAQLQDLTAAIKQCNDKLLIGVDQEGGRVQRFKQQFTLLPSMHVFDKLFRQQPEEGMRRAEDCGWLMATEVLAVGIDLSFAPVLDLYSSHSRIIKDRAFSSDPETVGDLADAFIKGMHAAGMAATAKHFPGHGSVAGDSHVELPVDERTLETLWANDLLPFRRCINCIDAVMPGHVLYPQVDNHVAALSRRWLEDILRSDLGFDGVIFSDDLTMSGATSGGDILQRSELALKAGCDMILVCNDRSQALTVIDWLEQKNWPANYRLASMLGRPKLNWNDLSADPRWQAASTELSNLN